MMTATEATFELDGKMTDSRRATACKPQDNDKTSQQNLEYDRIRQRTSFVINYTITVFAVALLLITAFNTIQAQEAAGASSDAANLTIKKNPPEPTQPLPTGTSSTKSQLVGQAFATRTTKNPALTSRLASTSSDLMSRSTRQTRATTRKHSSTEAEAVDDFVTASTTLDPDAAKSSSVEDSDSETAGKSGVKLTKDKKKIKAKRREEEEEDEETDEDEERERERERSRRRKLRNRLKSSTTTPSTTTTSTSTTTTTTTTSSPTTRATSGSSAGNSTETTTAVSKSSTSHQHQNISHPGNASLTTVSPTTRQKVELKNLSSTAAPESLNSTVRDSFARLGLAHGHNGAAGRPNATHPTQPSGATNSSHTEPLIGNKTIADIIREATNDQNSIKGLDESMKHFKLICSVSPAGNNPELLASVGRSKNDTSPTATTAGLSNNSSATSSPIPSLRPSHLSPVAHDQRQSQQLHNLTNSSLLGNTSFVSGHPVKGFFNNSTNSSSAVVPVTNQGSGFNLKSNSSQESTNSADLSSKNIGNKSISEIVRDMNNDHEKIEDHVKEQAQSLRHFIVICSVSVVLATSLVVALITLLMK